MMVVAAMVSLFARPDVFVQAFRMLTRRQREVPREDVLRDIELPLRVSWVGVPIIGALGVWMAQEWFGVHWLLGAGVYPADPGARADRRKQHGADRHHALEFAVKDPAVHRRRASNRARPRPT